MLSLFFFFVNFSIVYSLGNIRRSNLLGDFIENAIVKFVNMVCRNFCVGEFYDELIFEHNVGISLGN